MSDVQRPLAATNAEGDDLLEPTQAYLKGVGLLGRVDETTDKPWVITAEELSITGRVEKWIQGLGITSSGVVAAAGGLWGAIQDQPVVLAAAAVGLAIIIAAMILGLARVMDGDVRSRSAVTVGQLEARSRAIGSLLTSFDAAAKDAKADSEPAETDTDEHDEAVQALSESRLLAAMARFGAGLRVTTADEPVARAVVAVEWTNDKLRIKCDDGDWIKASEVSGFTSVHA